MNTQLFLPKKKYEENRCIRRIIQSFTSGRGSFQKKLQTHFHHPASSVEQTIVKYSDPDALVTKQPLVANNDGNVMLLTLSMITLASESMALKVAYLAGIPSTGSSLVLKRTIFKSKYYFGKIFRHVTSTSTKKSEPIP